MFKDLWAEPREARGAGRDALVAESTRPTSRSKSAVCTCSAKSTSNASGIKRTVLATEHPFLVPFGEHELTGYVDLLEVRRSGKGRDLLRVVDYKTASRRPNMAELALDVQFTTYMWAVEQREFWFGATNPDGTPNPDFPPVVNPDWSWEMYHDLSRRAIWMHLWDFKEIDAGPRVDSDFLRLYRVCQEVEKADRLQRPRSAHRRGLPAVRLQATRARCRSTSPPQPSSPTQDDAWV
jgi:hypothetical protein